MPTPDDVIGWARKLDPYPYVFGAELSGTAPGPADCSELVEYAVRNAGGKISDGSGNQFFACYNAGLSIPLDQAIHTKGALLFYSHSGTYPPPNAGRDYIYHVAISLGDGVSTFEARSESAGIYQAPVAGRSWYNHGGLIPGVDYGGGTPTPVPPTSADWGPMRELRESDPRMKGTDVSAVQVMLLYVWGLIVDGGADGVYGPGTAGAVRAFQDAHDLAADGIVGTLTRTKLAGG